MSQKVFYSIEKYKTDVMLKNTQYLYCRLQTNTVHTVSAIQPTVHPVLIPQNQFCVMSLDPDTLPSIATTLIDVLFYSNRWDAPWLMPL